MSSKTKTMLEVLVMVFAFSSSHTHTHTCQCKLCVCVCVCCWPCPCTDSYLCHWNCFNKVSVQASAPVMLGDNQHICAICSSLWPVHADYRLDLWSCEAALPPPGWPDLCWNGMEVQGDAGAEGKEAETTRQDGGETKNGEQSMRNIQAKKEVEHRKGR